MKTLFNFLFVSSLSAAAAFASAADEHAAASSHAEDAAPPAGLIVLEEAGVRNLGLRTAEAVQTVFEETAFVLGVIEARPESVGTVASRISGRVVALSAFPGDTVAKGQEVMRIESRQAGSQAVAVSLAAPLAGTVTQLDVRLGDPVEPDRSLLTVTALDEVFAVARVPETLVPAIRAGATAAITLPALGGEPLTGRLLRLGVSADAQAGTVDAIFVLPNADHRILPGMRAEFAIVLSERQSVLSIPRRALQGTRADRFVYVRYAPVENAFVRMPVVVGRINDRFAEIVSGLSAGDEVATDGAYSLSFVGGAMLSLKEALDAAHGHSHAEDGSELSGGGHGSKAAGGQSGKDDHSHGAGHSHGDGHDHDDDDDHSGHGHGMDWLGSALVWQIVSGVLLLVLLFTLGGRRRTEDVQGVDSAASADAKGSDGNSHTHVEEGK